MIYLNLFGGWWYDKDLSWTDLSLFIFMSSIIISFLLFYYRKISSKNKGQKSQVDVSIYNSKDIFSQEIVGDTNFVLAERSTSIYTKIIVCALVFVLLTSSSSMLLKNLYIY